LEGKEQGPPSPGKENPLIEIGDKLCPEDETNGMCSGKGTCKLGMCFVLLHLLNVYMYY